MLASDSGDFNGRNALRRSGVLELARWRSSPLAANLTIVA
jgi:hypothetical protein